VVRELGNDFYNNHVAKGLFYCSLMLILIYVISDMSMPIAHVEESWQMAEFYNNKVLYTFISSQ
jgi:adenylyl cyclase-associated protein